MKRLFIFLSALAFMSTAEARLAGANFLTNAEKISTGFEIQYLGYTKVDNFNEGYEIKFQYGNTQSAFDMILTARVLLPIANDDFRKITKVKIGTNTLALSPELSQQVYQQLSVDFTASKIARGIDLHDATIQCGTTDECLFSDQFGDFYAFEGDLNYFGDTPTKFIASLYQPLNKYKSVPFNGQVLEQNENLSQEFLNAIEEKVFELAPSEFVYFQIERSTPTSSISIEEHKQIAKADLGKALGSHPIENFILGSFLTDVEIQFKEKVRKNASSNCTYFCGASGPFVEATMESGVLF